MTASSHDPSAKLRTPAGQPLFLHCPQPLNTRHLLLEKTGLSPQAPNTRERCSPGLHCLASYIFLQETRRGLIVRRYNLPCHTAGARRRAWSKPIATALPTTARKSNHTEPSPEARPWDWPGSRPLQLRVTLQPLGTLRWLYRVTPVMWNFVAANFSYYCLYFLDVAADVCAWYFLQIGFACAPRQPEPSQYFNIYEGRLQNM